MTDAGQTERSAFRENLLVALRQEVERQGERRAALAEKVRLENALLEEAKARETGAREEKLRLATEIFGCLDGLRHDSELCNRLGGLRESGAELFSQGLFINGWRWAHTPRAVGECCWSRTYLRESSGKPELYYWAGYKWMNTGPHMYSQSPEDLAERFSLDYLRQLRRSFEDGTVYETIKHWHVGRRWLGE